MLKIRLARGGAKKRPYYYIVVADSHSPRDGKFLERVGSYNPMLPKDGPTPRVTLKVERIAEWLGNDLGQEVWNLSMDGGQFSGAMIKALKQESSWPQSLQLVIWEFSENTLSLPLADDEKKALKEITVPVLAAASTQGG